MPARILLQMNGRASLNGRIRSTRVKLDGLPWHPDGVCAPTAAAEVSYENIGSILEFKTEVETGTHRGLLSGLGCPARESMSNSINRRFILAGALTGDIFRLYMFDRSNTTVYRSFDIHKKPGYLVRILCFLSTANDAALGFDPTVELIACAKTREAGEDRSKYRISLSGSLRFDAGQKLFENKTIRRRATRVYRGEYFDVNSPNDRRPGVLKDACQTSLALTRSSLLKRSSANPVTISAPRCSPPMSASIQQTARGRRTAS